MTSTWPTTEFSDADEVFRILTELQGKRWLCRGHSKLYGGLIPSIDRKPRQSISRVEKLRLERQSIDLFRSTVRYFSDPGEKRALEDDLVALMVLRHFGIPTRLLDWTLSPYVASFFACWSHAGEDGEIWAFEYDRYVSEGTKQWEMWPEATERRSGKGEHFDAKLTAFLGDEPPNWFVCGFYDDGFPRQRAQKGAYSFTARFDRDHAEKIAELMSEDSYYHRYVIPKNIKPGLRTRLREEHGIWDGSLFPDSAGAADFVQRTVFPKGHSP